MKKNEFLNSKFPRISFKLKYKKHLQVKVETKRLIIYSYHKSHFDDCLALYGDPVLTKYFDHGKPRSNEEVKQLIKEKADKYFDHGLPFGLFSIFDKENGNFIGQFDLIPATDPQVVEIGCIFHRPYHNRGYCPEVVKCFLNEYIEKINQMFRRTKRTLITKAIATTHPKNFASIRMIKLVGMKYEKTESRFGTYRKWFACPVPQTINKVYEIGA